MSHDLQVLMADVLAGKLNSDVVLVDLLQQYGASRETALDFIHGLRLGSELEGATAAQRAQTAAAVRDAGGRDPMLVDIVRPFTLYDTDEGCEAGGRCVYFRNFGFIRGARNGEMKMRDEANFTQPQRLPSYSKMRLRRLSAQASVGAESVASVQLRVNQRGIWEGPLVDLLTPLGVPVREEFNDRDDINMHITWTQDGRGHFVRLNLHGWLTEPLGR